MKYSLYERLIPKSIRDRVYHANVQRYQVAELKRRGSIEDSAIRVELSAVYIENLRVLVNRDAFFNSMPEDAVAAILGRSQDGDLTRALLITRPQRLHLINTWETEKELEVISGQFKEEIASKQLIINRGNPAGEIKGFPDNSLDWVYINNGFRFETTSELLEICGQKVRETGIIGGSNYARGSWIYGQRYGVIEAVHEFCKKNGWEMIYLTHESCRQLSYAIRRIETSRYGAADTPGR